MADLKEYKQTTWTFLANITYQWQYDGIANLFRKNGIPLYGIDLGSTKENHVFLGVFVPKNMNRNYGVNIFVPEGREREARQLIRDEAALREAAQAEQTEGSEHYRRFSEEAWANKRRDQREYREAGGVIGDLSRRGAALFGRLRSKGNGASAG